MRPDRLFPSSITVHRVTQDGPPDEMGDPTEETVDTTYARAGSVWQVQRRDETGNTDVQYEEWKGALRRDLVDVVAGGDRITVEGETFELEGPPWPARNPRTGRIEFLEVTLRRTT
jgi:hypothetical protein